ncbi:MAG: hypothetical protein M1814_006500 [Vezdaea aestivalis]|nr:MAG: hypothetical protein M1814_006500 [Vezdaea aestivalis]
MSSKQDPTETSGGDDYVPKQGKSDFVQKDDAPVQDPIDSESADSDKTLAQDEDVAIDSSNIIKERTRGAAPSEGYSEPSEDDIPEA